MKKLIIFIQLAGIGTLFSFKLGIENLSHSFLHTLSINQKINYRVALVANQTAKDHEGKTTLQILREKGLNVVYIFAPEHGYDGTVLAGEKVQDSIDKQTGIPIVSLYGFGTGKKVDSEKLKDIDVLFFDIQDSGMRHYTYISTLLVVLKAAAEYDKQLVVLDRPNLLGGIMEGPLVDPGYESFISIAPIPLRHGMTIGELAWYFNKNILEKQARLHVVKMKDYNRTGKIFKSLLAPLSPNLPCLTSCYGYSFLGLLGEVEPFDIGVGTRYPFQVFGLPDGLLTNQQWKELSSLLKDVWIENRTHVYFNARKKKHYHGLRLAFDEMGSSSFLILLKIINFIQEAQIPIKFLPAFDKAIGTCLVQEFVQQKIGYNQLQQKINKELKDFYQKAESSLLYDPKPRIAYMPEKLG